MGSVNDPIHWTEIYAIVAVSATLIEQMRKVNRGLVVYENHLVLFIMNF